MNYATTKQINYIKSLLLKNGVKNNKEIGLSLNLTKWEASALISDLLNNPKKTIKVYKDQLKKEEDYKREIIERQCQNAFQYIAEYIIIGDIYF